MDKTPSKPAGKAKKKAAQATTNKGQKVTRNNTPDRNEVHQSTIKRRGHSQGAVD